MGNAIAGTWHVKVEPTFWDYVGAVRHSRYDKSPCTEIGGHGTHCTPLMDGNVNFEIHHSAIIHFYGSCLCAILMIVKLLSIFFGRYDIHRYLDGRFVFIVFMAHAFYYKYYWDTLEDNGTHHPILFDTHGEYEDMSGLIEFVLPIAIIGVAGIVATKNKFHLVFWFTLANSIGWLVRWIILGITLQEHEFQSDIPYIVAESMYVWALVLVVLLINMYIYARWYLYGLPSWKNFHRYHGALLSSGTTVTMTHFTSRRFGTLIDAFQADILGQLAVFICLWPEVRKNLKENPKKKEIYLERKKV